MGPGVRHPRLVRRNVAIGDSDPTSFKGKCIMNLWNLWTSHLLAAPTLSDETLCSWSQVTPGVMGQCLSMWTVVVNRPKIQRRPEGSNVFFFGISDGLLSETRLFLDMSNQWAFPCYSRDDKWGFVSRFRLPPLFIRHIRCLFICSFLPPFYCNGGFGGPIPIDESIPLDVHFQLTRRWGPHSFHNQWCADGGDTWEAWHQVKLGKAWKGSDVQSISVLQV